MENLINLCDMQGKLVMRTQLEAGVSHINVSALAEGNYMIHNGNKIFHIQLKK